MHSASIITALLAAGVLGAPSQRHQHLHHARQAVDIVQVVDYATQWVTDVQTVTAGQNDAYVQQAAPTPPAPQNNAPAWPWGQQGGRGQAPSQAPPAASYTPPPPPPPPSSTYTPPPPPSSTSTAPSSTSAASTPPASPAASAPNSYAQAIVDAHNAHRANHSVSNLEWHDGLAQAAQALASTCNFAHNTDLDKATCGFPDGYGQNLAAGSGSGTDQSAASSVSNGWYNGEMTFFAPFYGMANPDDSLFEKFGHFTQLVWKDTTHVGCASQQCGVITGTNPPFGGSFMVCNYGPPGNYGGQYGNNVLQPQGMATVTGT